jgi:tetratricopeptide (TPR) repeat protein
VKIFPYLLLIVFLLSAPAFSIQSKNKHWRNLKRTELEEKITSEKNYKDRIDLLNLLSYKLSYYEHSTAIDKAKEALEAAKGSGSNPEYAMGIVDSLNNLGLIYTRKGELDTSKNFYDRARIKAGKCEYKVGEAESYNGFCRYYQLKGLFDTAFARMLKSQLLLDSLKKSDEGLSERANANLSHRLAVIYFYDTNAYDETYNYFMKSLSLRQKIGDIDEIGITYYSLGEVLQKQGKYFEAKEYFKKAESIAKEIGNEYIIANVKQGMGDISKKEEKSIDKALEYYRESLEKFKQIGDKFQMATLNRDIGLCLLSQEKYEESESFLKESYKLAKELDNAHTIKTVAEKLTEVYKKLGKDKEKNEYAKIAEEKKRIMDEFSMPSIYEKITQAQKSASQRQLLLVIMMISLFFTTIAFLYFIKAKRANTKLEKSNKGLELQRRKIEKSNKDLEFQRERIEKSLKKDGVRHVQAVRELKLAKKMKQISHFWA